MSDQPRLLTRACLSLSEVKVTLYQAGADGVYTCKEIDEVIEKLDYAYLLAEEAEGVEIGYEYARKNGVDSALNRPNMEKVVSVLEFRQRREAKQKAMSAGDYSPDIA